MPGNVNLWPAATCNTLNLGVTVFWSCFLTVSNARTSHASITISLPSFCSKLFLLGAANFLVIAVAVGARSNEQLQEHEQARAQGMLSWTCPPIPNAHLASAGEGNKPNPDQQLVVGPARRLPKHLSHYAIRKGLLTDSVALMGSKLPRK